MYVEIQLLGGLHEVYSHIMVRWIYLFLCLQEPSACHVI